MEQSCTVSILNKFITKEEKQKNNAAVFTCNDDVIEAVTWILEGWRSSS